MRCKTAICTVAICALSAVGAGAQAALPDIAALVPPRMQAPAVDGLLKCFQLLTFAAHLILVNIVLGSVLLAIIDPHRAYADAKTGVAFMPKVLALAVNFGIAPFLFLQVVYGSFLYPAMVLMAVWWVSIIFAVMLAYYGLYVGDGFPDRRRPVLWLTALMLLMTAFLLTNMSTLLQNPERWLRWFADPNGTILNITDPTLFPRFVHILVASLAVGGLTMAWRAEWSRRYPETDPADAERGIRKGLNWFFYASIAQLGAGPLFLVTHPPEVWTLFLTGSALHTTALLLALAGLSIALYFGRLGNLRLTTSAIGGVILIMVCVRELVRDALLAPYSANAAARTIPLAMPDGQGGALWFFLGCAIMTVFVIVWLVRVLLRTYAQAGITENGEG